MISRRKASIKNALNTFVAQFTKMFGQFVVQTIFIHTLGAVYLGANGLFNNIVTFLSFAELGIGSAFAYSLYKPLADNDHETVRSVLDLFRKVYNTIGLVILTLGTLLTLFIPYLTSGSTIPHLRFSFFLYLLSTVVSYFFTYNRTLLISDQAGYLDARNQLFFSVFRYILQIFFLIFFKSYYGYLIAQVVGNLFANIAITRIARKRYPYLTITRTSKVPSKIISEIKRNVVGTISSKVGLIIVTGTDNILISKFVSLVAVGIYSNYSLIINAFTVLLNQVLSSVVSSFGNLGVTEKNNIKKQLYLFDQFIFYNAFSTFFIGLVSFAVFQQFIFLWIGSKFELSISTLAFIIVNFTLSQFRPALFLVNAYGLFWGYRVKSIVEAIVNFGLSFCLVKFTTLGINGVLLGTIAGNILVNSWWDPLILFSGAYNKSIGPFYIKYWMYNFVFFFGLFLEWLWLKHINVPATSILSFVGSTIVIAFGVILYLLVCFARTSGEKELLRNIVQKIKRV